MATTSGTVSSYPFDQRKVLDHAFRRAGLLPQMNSPENLSVAQDLIFLITGEWINAGFPLWTRQFNLLGITQGSPDVVCLPGTAELIHCYWRIFNPYRGPATTTTGANAAVLFGGAPNADVTIAGPNPGVNVNFGAPMEVDTIGVLLGGSSGLTAALLVQTSQDGIAWTTVQTLPSAAYAPMNWTYFDLDPTLTTQYIQVVSPGVSPWTVNQLQFGLANGEDILIGPLNIDDYYNLPNKLFQSDRANSAYVDRFVTGAARDQQIIRIWPTPNANGFYNGAVSALTRRYIQDPGAMTNAVEVPQRWLEALIARLATKLIDEIPDEDPSAQASYFSLMAKQQRIQRLEAAAEKAEALAWSEERTRGPIRFMPAIRGYTR